MPRRRHSKAVPLPRTSPLTKLAENNSVNLLRQISFSNRLTPEYHRLAIPQEIWPGHTQSHFGWARVNALFAEVKIFCALTAAASWNGPYCSSCSCARSAVAEPAEE